MSNLLRHPGAARLVGDWDGDGRKTLGVRVGSRVVLVNETGRLAAPSVVLSLGRASDEVYVGDWDGDGRDTLALRRGGVVLEQQAPTSSQTRRVTVAGLSATSTLRVERRGGHDVLVVVG